MTCRVVLSLLDDYIDNELAPPQAAELQAHLQSCSSCRVEAERSRRLKELLADAPHPEPGSQYWRELTPLVNAKTIDAEPVPAYVERSAVMPAQRTELLRALVTCAASLALLAAAVLVGSQHQSQAARIHHERRPFLVTAPLEAVLASDHTALVTIDEQQSIIRGSFVLGPPGPLGRFLALPELHRQ
jgi:anti-sigma factor RsiW